ncbi:PREDICTED: uncharacterized protein C2orf42 homolog [Ficedula albicollis]|uniref:uncharacterized protein C2orf42 homolog n=1 Tax=Ficedula albicollis TaxID=59894 RepID=UPI0007AD7B04|nr:PREDICTED: uncharacterized protein C2orf42 homolog [Ficedula albicollis]
MLGNPGRRRSMDPCPGRPKAPSFLSDLGKATLRGIRKCPRCGTYNGTRGLSCKNKTCGAVFRGTRCIHFLACICAFASDDSLAQEFSHFLASDAGGLKGTVIPQLLRGPAATARPRGTAAARAKRRRKDLAGPQGPGPLLAPDPAQPGPRRSSLRKPPVASSSSSSSSLKRHGCPQALDESQVSLSFQEWLGSVTERIHQTMHYQFEGHPEPLVFHIPQSFFEALQQRISSGSGKKRLPNSTTAFVRRDALPLGTFSKYTWHITNVLQVKQIFDTPEVPLEITRSFVQNRDGSYEPFRSPRVEVESLAEGHEKQPPLRPLELQTFLKVGKIPWENRGNTLGTQKEPTPFTIEWIPDILPRSRLGKNLGDPQNGRGKDGGPGRPQNGGRIGGDLRDPKMGGKGEGKPGRPPELAGGEGRRPQNEAGRRMGEERGETRVTPKTGSTRQTPPKWGYIWGERGEHPQTFPEPPVGLGDAQHSAQSPPIPSAPRYCGTGGHHGGTQGHPGDGTHGHGGMVAQ